MKGHSRGPDVIRISDSGTHAVSYDSSGLDSTLWYWHLVDGQWPCIHLALLLMTTSTLSWTWLLFQVWPLAASAMSMGWAVQRFHLMEWQSSLVYLAVKTLSLCTLLVMYLLRILGFLEMLLVKESALTCHKYAYPQLDVIHSVKSASFTTREFMKTLEEDWNLIYFIDLPDVHELYLSYWTMCGFNAVWFNGVGIFTDVYIFRVYFLQIPISLADFMANFSLLTSAI